MPNLMITSSGALGDTLYSVPGLNLLRPLFDNIYQSGRKFAPLALENTGLVDKFIVKPEEFKGWDYAFRESWLQFQVNELGLEWDVFVNLHKVIAGRLMFHKNDPQFNIPQHCKVCRNKGRNYFDEITLRFQENLGIDMSEALGKRPITKHTHEEKGWLRDFRYIYEIPQDAFLLGWQFTGSARYKWYPYFKQVIQESIMQRFPEVYLIGLGDLEGLIKWDRMYHHGRFVNLRDTVSFRQALILTSELDLLVSPETGIYVGAQAYEQTPKILLATHTDGTHITCGDESVILESTSECAPCYNLLHSCNIDPESNSPRCISSIKPLRLIKAIREVIDRKRRMDSLRIKPQRILRPKLQLAKG